MSIPHSWNLSLTARGLSFSYTVPIGADGGDSREVEIAANDTTSIDFAFTKAQLRSILISCPVAVSVKTNDPDTPQETIELEAGKPFMWHEDMYLENPFVDDVTSLHITRVGAETELTIEWLVDATP